MVDEKNYEWIVWEKERLLLRKNNTCCNYLKKLVIQSGTKRLLGSFSCAIKPLYIPIPKGTEYVKISQEFTVLELIHFITRSVQIWSQLMWKLPASRWTKCKSLIPNIFKKQESLISLVGNRVAGTKFPKNKVCSESISLSTENDEFSLFDKDSELVNTVLFISLLILSFN